MKIVCPECDEKMMDETIGWRCPKCKGFVSSLDGKFYPHVDRPFMPPMTNAARLRAMNDDELSEQLVIDVDGLQPCRMYLSAPTGKIYLSRAEAVRETKDWLQQPAEED